MVYIAEAVKSENKNDAAGWKGLTKDGDQLQKIAEQLEDFEGECRMSPYRNFATIVFRYKDRELAKKHAAAARYFVNSKMVGYNQAKRLDLKNYVKALGYANYTKMKKNKDTDCSALQCLCSNIVGIKEVKDWNSDLMITNYAKLTQYFEVLTDKKYLTSSDYLLEGDILVKPGHAACTLNDGDKVNVKPEQKPADVNKAPSKKETLQSAPAKVDSLTGKYSVITDLNLRYGPNSSYYSVIRVLKQGEKVACYGYCDYKLNPSWVLVKTDKDKIVGWVNKSYLKKL